MKNSPIVMTRGKGWNTTAWETHKPALERAAEKTERGLRAQNIAYETYKLGIVDRCTPKVMTYDAGAAYDARRFVLLVDGRTQRTPSGSDVAEWACTTLHEVVHCARFEKEIGSTVMELAASEGLAYLAEELFRKQTYRKRVTSRFMEYDLIPNPRLSEQFKEVAELPVASPAAQEWYLKRPWVEELRNVDYLGLQRVYAQVERGYSISDLMSQPAGDVLGL